MQDPVGLGVVVRPWKRLLAFAAVKGVAPGAQASVGIDVLADDLAYYGDDLALRVHAGEYVVSAGLSSLDDTAHATAVTVPASYTPPWSP